MNSPIATPIVRSTTWRFGSSAELLEYRRGDKSLYMYSRDESPTVRAAESVLAKLEGAEAAILFASGMGAMSTALFGLSSAGDELICATALYGGTWKLLRDLLSRFGVRARAVDPSRLAEACAEGPVPKLCILETPTNPGLRVLDVEAIAQACRARGIVTIIDATFATPHLIQPLSLGIDLVMHSTSKFLNGHSDALGGVLCGSTARIEPLRKIASALGATPAPDAAYALLRGIKTFPVRMERICQTAEQIAEWLAGQSNVARVIYPGLTSHPDHAIAKAQLRAMGGMVTFSLNTKDRACRFWDRLKLVARAASLGGTESLASLPILFSHTGYSPDELKAAGVDEGMVRLSIGLEDPRDLIADLEQALRGL